MTDRETDRLTDREKGARVFNDRQRETQQGEKYSEMEREESIQRVRGRGRACAVSLI